MKTRGYYLTLGLLALALASVPYLYGALNTPKNLVYYGLTSNIDDCMAYFSWINEYASGKLAHRNLFSTEPNTPIVFYLWFGLLGLFSKAIGTLGAFHLGRVLGGAGLLWAVYWLLNLTLTDERAKKLAFGFVCFASGFGWLFGGFDPAKGFYLQPIDTFSPEAITFLSLGYSPLFAPMTALMVVFVAGLLRAEQTGRLKGLWPACLAGAILGNSHTYDVVPLFLMAGAWTILRKPERAAWVRLVTLGVCCLPTALYNLIASRLDPLFKARVWGNEPTLTAPLWWVLLGLGLPLIFALVGLARRDRAAFCSASAWKLMLCWLGAHLLAAYLPVPVQRKLLMGVHLPVCLLAGAGLSGLLGKLTGDFPRALGPIAVLLALPGTLLSVINDAARLDANVGSTAARPYLTQSEKDALDWLKTSATEGAVLVGPDPASAKRFPFQLAPHLAPQVAGLSGRTVFNGHWSETLSYRRKFSQSLRFFLSDTDDDFRRTLCAENKISYVLSVNSLGAAELPEISPVVWTPENHPSWLEVAYQNPEITVFRVRP